MNANVLVDDTLKESELFFEIVCSFRFFIHVVVCMCRFRLLDNGSPLCSVVHARRFAHRTL